MLTIKEIARMAGVSPATVSHVINDTHKISPETTKRVMEVIQSTNYHPNRNAKALRQGRSNTIGIIAEDICGMPTAQIVDGVSETLEMNGMRMLFMDMHLMRKLNNHYELTSTYHQLLEECVALLASSDVAGIIYIAMHDRDLTHYLDEITLPLVVAYSRSDANLSVCYDNERSAAEATQLLLNNGHRRIALLAGHAMSQPSNERVAAFRRTMTENGVAVREEYLHYCDWEMDEAEEASNKLFLLDEPPTAIFALNDVMAAGCMRAAYKRGLRVPDDVSVIGFDNQNLSTATLPRLSTIEIPCREIGQASVHMMKRLLRTPDMTITSETLPCRLIERESIAPISNS